MTEPTMWDCDFDLSTQEEIEVFPLFHSSLSHSFVYINELLLQQALFARTTNWAWVISKHYCLDMIIRYSEYLIKFCFSANGCFQRFCFTDMNKEWWSFLMLWNALLYAIVFLNYGWNNRFQPYIYNHIYITLTLCPNPPLIVFNYSSTDT